MNTFDVESEISTLYTRSYDNRWLRHQLHFRLLKIFGHSLNFWQTLFVVSGRYNQINHSINQSISVICIVTRCQIFTAEMHQIQFWLGFRPRHRWEPTGPLAGGDGAGCLVPPPQEPNPLARPSTLGPFGPRYTSSSYRLSPHKRKGQTPPICRQ